MQWVFALSSAAAIAPARAPDPPILLLSRIGPRSTDADGGGWRGRLARVEGEDEDGSRYRTIAVRTWLES
jgi:hypothetical protein